MRTNKPSLSHGCCFMHAHTFIVFFYFSVTAPGRCQREGRRQAWGPWKSGRIWSQPILDLTVYWVCVLRHVFSVLTFSSLISETEWAGEPRCCWKEYTSECAEKSLVHGWWSVKLVPWQGQEDRARCPGLWRKEKFRMWKRPKARHKHYSLWAGLGAEWKWGGEEGEPPSLGKCVYFVVEWNQRQRRFTICSSQVLGRT